PPQWALQAPLTFGRARLLHVDAGAEPPAGAGEDHHADGTVRLEGVERVVELADELAAQRVELVRAIEREQGDPLAAALQREGGHASYFGKAVAQEATWPGGGVDRVVDRDLAVH